MSDESAIHALEEYGWRSVIGGIYAGDAGTAARRGGEVVCRAEVGGAVQRSCAEGASTYARGREGMSNGSGCGSVEEAGGVQSWSAHENAHACERSSREDDVEGACAWERGVFVVEHRNVYQLRRRGTALSVR